VPILPDFSSHEVKTIVDHSEAKVFFVSEGLYHKIENENLDGVEKIILLEQFTLVPKGTKAKELASLTPADLQALAPVTVSAAEEEDLASIIYTSGTTGNSKGVMLTQKNIAWTGKQAYTMQPVNENDRFLSILPLSHSYENTLGLLLPLFHGASVYYLRKPPTAPVLLPALELVKPTKLLSVPLVIEKIFKGKIYPALQKSPVTRTLYKVPVMRKLLHRVAGKKLMKTFGGKIDFFESGAQNSTGPLNDSLRKLSFPMPSGMALPKHHPCWPEQLPRHHGSVQPVPHCKVLSSGLLMWIPLREKAKSRLRDPM
jgi:long-chain acyl-CoA synthetase